MPFPAIARRWERPDRVGSSRSTSPLRRATVAAADRRRVRSPGGRRSEVLRSRADFSREPRDLVSRVANSAENVPELGIRTARRVGSSRQACGSTPDCSAGLINEQKRRRPSVSDPVPSRSRKGRTVGARKPGSSDQRAGMLLEAVREAGDRARNPVPVWQNAPIVVSRVSRRAARSVRYSSKA